jgi:probable phosphoglycerate mutase
MMAPPPEQRPPTRWYIIRHGQTEFNARNIVQGSGIDAPLDATGHHQAASFFNQYRNIPFGAIYVSGLQRTAQTVEPFSKLGLHLMRLPELNEINWGELEGQQGSPSVRAVFHETIQRWTCGELDYRIPGGESPLEVLDRLKRGLDLIQKTAPPGPILICSHGRTLRILLSYLLGYGLERMQYFEHDNTGLNLLVPLPNRHYALKINDLSHLHQ